MLKTLKIDPTKDPIIPSIFKYALPVFLTQIIQTLMNAADTAVLGNIADSTAVASVGATSSLVALLVSSMSGLAEGGKVIFAQALGAGDTERCKKVRDTAIILALSVGAVVALVGCFFSRAILTAMDCPDDCIDGAVTYLTIYLLSAPLTLLYNFGAGIIAISGNSAKPMKYMLISGMSNVVLNIIFCLFFENKVVAVAIATVIGTSISTVLVLRDLIKDDRVPLNVRNMTFSLKDLALIVKLGIPISFNSAMYSISNIQIQSAINSYGSAAIAGNTATVYVESAVGCFTTAFHSTLLAFVGQNAGAGNKDRVGKSIKYCILFGFMITLPVSIIAFILGKNILSIFIPGNVAAIEFGRTRLKYVTTLYGMATITSCCAGIMNALGYTFIVTFASAVTILGFRLVWMTFIYHLNPTPDMLYVCFSLSWILQFIVLVTVATIFYSKYKKDKLKLITSKRN